MATPLQYETKEAAITAMNAINASNLADADILSLTTANALAALFQNRASARWGQRMNMQFHYQSIVMAISAGIFTDANVAAADTVAGLRAILIAVNATLTTGFQSGRYAWA